MGRHICRLCSACVQPITTVRKLSRIFIQVIAASCTGGLTNRPRHSTPVESTFGEA